MSQGIVAAGTSAIEVVAIAHCPRARGPQEEASGPGSGWGSGAGPSAAG